jgi:hypothetical protein
MRGVVLEGFDTASVLRNDLPAPTVSENQVLVRVHASSVNPVDAAIAGGMLRGMVDYEFPVVLGRDYTGVVERVGPSAAGYSEGDHVFGFLLHANPKAAGARTTQLQTPPTLYRHSQLATRKGKSPSRSPSLTAPQRDKGRLGSTSAHWLSMPPARPSTPAPRARRRQPAPETSGRRSPIRCPGRCGLAPQLHEGTFERATGSVRFAGCAVGDSIRCYADVLLVGNSVGRVPVKPVPAPLGGIAPGTSGTRGFGGSFHTCQFAQVVGPPASRRLSGVLVRFVRGGRADRGDAASVRRARLRFPVRGQRTTQCPVPPVTVVVLARDGSRAWR